MTMENERNGSGSDNAADIDDGCLQRSFSRLNASTENALYGVGKRVGSHPIAVLISVVVVFLGLASGILQAESTTSLNDLWVESDSRIRPEEAFYDEFFAPSDTRSEVIISYDATEFGADVATEAHLADFQTFMEELSNVTIEHESTFGTFEFSYAHLCQRVEVVSGATVLRLPCTRYTPLDCFSEGGYDFAPGGITSNLFVENISAPDANDLGGLLTQDIVDPFNDYEGRPSYQGMSGDEILDFVGTDSCFTYHELQKPPLNVIYGGDTSPNDGVIVARSLNALMSVMGPSTMAKIICGTSRSGCNINSGGTRGQRSIDDSLQIGASSCLCDDPTQEQLDAVEDILLTYERALLDYVDANKDRFDTLHFTLFAQRSTGDLTDEAGSANFPLIIIGYVVMLIFVSISSFDRRSAVKSRVGAALGGVALVILATLGSFGLAAYVGIKFSPSVTQVLPFLAVALGVDDMFVMLHTLTAHTNVRLPPDVQCGITMKAAGTSITLTSLCNLIAFAIASTIPLPAAATFAAAAAIVVAFNYIAIALGFTAVLALDARRIAAGRWDILCCKRREDYDLDSENVKSVSLASPAEETLVDKFVSLYASALAHPVVKVVLLGGFTALLVLTAIRIPDVNVGLPLGEIVPADSAASDFLTAYEEFLYTGSSTLLLGINKDGEREAIDYVERWQDIMAAEAVFQQLENVEDSIPISLQSWVDNMDGWIRDTINDTELQGAVTRTVDFVDETRTGIYSLEEGTWVAAEGFSAAENFNFALDAFLQDTAAAATVNPAYIVRDDEGTIIASRVDFYQVNTITTQDQIDFILESRRVADNDLGGLPIVPNGLNYQLFEQYINVRDYLGELLLYASVGVLAVSLLVLINPLGTLIMIGVLAMTMVEIYGMLYYAGLRINGVTVLNMVMGVAIVVEFVGHVTRAFTITDLRAQGAAAGRGRRPGVCSAEWREEMNERMKVSLRETAEPVTYGAISTFLGVLPMLFATFRYFQLYFFNMYCIIIFLGLANGLILLPIILSLVGPPPLRVLNSDKDLSAAAGAKVEDVELEGPTREAAAGTGATPLATPSKDADQEQRRLRVSSGDGSDDDDRKQPEYSGVAVSPPSSGGGEDSASSSRGGGANGGRGDGRESGENSVSQHSS